VIVPKSFSSLSAAIAVVRADLATGGFTGPVSIGKRFLKQRRDPTSGGSVIGSVVVVPVERSNLRAPRLTGGNPRPTFTTKRAIEVHCWARAASLGSFPTQYEADFAAAEVLTSAVLRSFEIYIPGAKDGGGLDLVEEGENVFGVEFVATLALDIETVDTTFAVATDAVFVPNYAAEFPDGHIETPSDP
jgi:hypothetical protein